jgi:hypothetical protein
VLFRAPRKLDFMQLVPLELTHVNGVDAWQIPRAILRRRSGFALTDPGMDCRARSTVALLHLVPRAGQGLVRARSAREAARRRALSCATSRESVQEEPVRRDARRLPARGKDLGVPQAARGGYPLAALAIICVDNPLGRGDRPPDLQRLHEVVHLPEDDPVDIPQAETRILKDVLALPWGFEIYSLLTRWNPLDLRRPTPRAATGKRTLVVGMGPRDSTSRTTCSTMVISSPRSTA